MEFNCPTCQTTLGVSNELDNPKVRCRVCGTIFRPNESGVASSPNPETQAWPSAPRVNPIQGEPEPTVSPFPVEPKTPPAGDSFSPSLSPVQPASRGRVRTPPQRESRGKGRWGIIAFIILMIVSRAPRLFRNFQREPPQPDPIAIDTDDIRQMFNDIVDEENRRQDLQLENEDIPQLPDGADPGELIFDEEAP